jgi:hypothetical protein
MQQPTILANLRDKLIQLSFLGSRVCRESVLIKITDYFIVDSARHHIILIYVVTTVIFLNAAPIFEFLIETTTFNSFDGSSTWISYS